MKCHAGVEFPSGTPCPKCKAELGEVCWPGINADLLELARLRIVLETIANIPITPDTGASVAMQMRRLAASTVPSTNREGSHD